MRYVTRLASALVAAHAFILPASAAEATHAVQPSPAQQAMPRTPAVPNTGGVAPAKGVSAGAATDSAISNLLSAIADTRTSAAAIKAMRQVAAIHVVRVHTVAKGDDARTVADALKGSRQDRKSLQTAFRGNPVLRRKLASKKVSTSQIVAARIEADGTLTVFTE